MKAFRIHNMKSFIDSNRIEIKPVTIFVGKNSCGKSSLLRFPAVIGQTFLARTESPLAFFGKFVDYGSFDSVKHKPLEKQYEKDEIGFEVEYDISKDTFFEYYMKQNPEDDEFDKIKDNWPEFFETRIVVSIDKPVKQISTKSVLIYWENIKLASFNRISEHQYEYTIYLNFTEDGYEERQNTINLDIDVDNMFYFIPMFNSDDAIELFHDQCIDKYKEKNDEQIEEEVEIFDNQINFASELVRVTVDTLLSEAMCMSYIGPFREDPKRIYRDTENDVRDVGAKGENLSTILLRESENDDGLIDEISDWLKRNYGYSLEISPASNGYFNILLVDKNGIKSNIMDVGYGISQVLPIITQLIRTTYVRNRTIIKKRDEIVLVEQPELHLHPAAQADLAELITFSIKEKDSQRILVETHSEHLIRKLQVLIAQKKYITSDMVAVYSVEKTQDGQAVVTKMELNNEGRFLTKWPSGFFDKTHELASELREANSCGGNL